MSAPQNFRTSFNGFNREDVVRYLEYINTRHNSQMEQMSSEVEYLRQQLDQYQDSPMMVDEIEALQAQCASLQAQLEDSLSIRRALEARCNGLERELEEALAAKAQAEEAHTAACCHVEQELEAYRRAERAEREARERADLVYYQANGVLTEATAKVDGISAEITDMADQVMAQLTQLQMAVSSSKQALQDASSIMNIIRPNK